MSQKIVDSIRTATDRSMRVTPSAPSVVQQARMMDAASPGTAWHAVKNGNLELITRLFPNQANVYEKGPLGENVFHLAMLLNTPSSLQIAKYLVKLYRAPLVNCPFQERKLITDPPGPYEGQTALHIAIMNRDFDMVKFLMQEGANVRVRAWGTFFHTNGPMYFGEFPLSFAACTGQKDVVAFLKRHGAKVNDDRDVHGNTALHMCVYHDQLEMYDYLVEYCGANELERNHTGLTPLVLSAQLGKEDMFEHIYERRRKAFYTFGKLTSYSLSLREIDTVQDKSPERHKESKEGDEGEYVPNALEVVLRKGHLHMLSEPLLQTILRYKWETFARLQFMLHFLGYILLMISQTNLIWLHNTPNQWNGPGRASQEFTGFVLAMLMFAIEMVDFWGWSRECYMRRLIMTVPDCHIPELYHVPGEDLELGGGRQGIFARWSARMGLGGGSSSAGPRNSGDSTRGKSPRGSPRSKSNLGPRVTGEQQGVGPTGPVNRGVHRPLSMAAATPFSGGYPAPSQSLLLPGATPSFAAGAAGGGPPGDGSAAAREAGPLGEGAEAGPVGEVTEGGSLEGSSRAAGPVGEGQEGSPQPASHSGPLPGVHPMLWQAAGSGSVHGSNGGDSDDEGTDVVSVGLPRARSHADFDPASLGLGPTPAAAAAGGPGRLTPSHSANARSSSVAAAAAAVAAVSSGTMHVAPGRTDSRGRLLGSLPGSNRPSYDAMASEMVPTPSWGVPLGATNSGPLSPGEEYKRSKSMGAGLSSIASSGNEPMLSGRSAVLESELQAKPSHLNEQLLSFLERQRTRPRSGGGDLLGQSMQRRPRGDTYDASGRRATAGESTAPEGSWRAGGASGLGPGGEGNLAGVAAGGEAGAGGEGGGDGGGKDLESQYSMKVPRDEPHKSPVRAILETWGEGAHRMLDDPWLFVWHTHLLVTFTHFIVWISSYGGIIGGPGPEDPQVRVLDDILVSMIGLSGWLAVVYFFRGIQATGKLTVILERCLLDVAKFISLYVLWNIGFTMAFYTMQHGTLLMMGTPQDVAPLRPAVANNLAFDSIGEGMMFLVQIGVGLTLDQYFQTCNVRYGASTVVCTIYYLLYLATTITLLLNLLLAMIIRTYSSSQEDAVRHWRRRWAIYVVKAERRMPSSWLHHHRLGQRTWDPRLQRTVYSHVFEVIEDDRDTRSMRSSSNSTGGAGDERSSTSEAQIKALEALLESLKKKQG